MPINFPSQIKGGQGVEIPHPTRIVIVGANGSGKTRLGIWLEDNNQSNMPVHRIGAQKVLALPDYAEVKNLEQAEKDVYFGRADQHASTHRKLHDRWGGNPATHMLSDYSKLLSLLFAKEGDRDREHTKLTREREDYIPVSDSAIDTIVKLWSYLMPHRTITFRDGKVMVDQGTPTEYHAKEMSDGERVTLYLLAQCLTAPRGALVIVDEPELHLHRSLMDKLWNKVEELCPDKSIIYITHDLDFAVSRTTANKYWVKSYAEASWTWTALPQDEELPESLILELVGNRKPVIFCEGERGGLDHTLYQLSYPNHHVVPRASAEKVIESVKALNSNAALHTLTAFGLIDRDVRTDEELFALERSRVYAIPFAEVENLLCNELVIQMVAKTLGHDPKVALDWVTDFVAKAATAEMDVQINLISARRIRYHLACFTPTNNNRLGLQAGVDKLLQTLNLNEITSTAATIYEAAIKSGKLDEMLKVYNRKSMADQISARLGMKHGEYSSLVLRLLKSERANELVEMFQHYLPKQ